MIFLVMPSAALFACSTLPFDPFEAVGVTCCLARGSSSHVCRANSTIECSPSLCIIRRGWVSDLAKAANAFTNNTSLAPLRSTQMATQRPKLSSTPTSVVMRSSYGLVLMKQLVCLDDYLFANSPTQSSMCWVGRSSSQAMLTPCWKCNMRQLVMLPHPLISVAIVSFLSSSSTPASSGANSTSPSSSPSRTTGTQSWTSIVFHLCAEEVQTASTRRAASSPFVGTRICGPELPGCLLWTFQIHPRLDV